MCVIDADAYDSNGAVNNGADAAPPQPQPTRAVAPMLPPATATPASTRGRCSVGLIGGGGSGLWAGAGAAIALAVSRRRRRAARL